ncbi:hypothetical protein ACNJYC_11340 [Bradyrhizobium sp. DASA03007]|uniref:hypothetical protein n=1 Tax=Bradyrhizobium sp. SPXBL-03 TaxID=3395913 RepID=UPI003F6FAEEC
MATRAPSVANRRAVARAMPRGEAAAEMMAALPLIHQFLPLIVFFLGKTNEQRTRNRQTHSCHGSMNLVHLWNAVECPDIGNSRL